MIVERFCLLYGCGTGEQDMHGVLVHWKQLCSRTCIYYAMCSFHFEPSLRLCRVRLATRPPLLHPGISLIWESDIAEGHLFRRARSALRW
jgi:hypothetical protein